MTSLTIVPSAEATSLEPLLTANDVAAILRIDRKKVYDLPIQRVTVSKGRVRYFKSDVYAFLNRHRRAA